MFKNAKSTYIYKRIAKIIYSFLLILFFFSCNNKVENDIYNEMFIYNNEIHLEKHISYELNKGNYILHINNDSVIAHKVYDISTHKFITYNDNYFVTKHYEGNNHIDWTIFSRKDTSTITFMNGIAIDFKRSVIAVMGTELNNSTIIIKNIYTQNTLSTIQLKCRSRRLR